MTPRLYTIKETALRVGISTQLIRKWEERYEAVAPTRMHNGYRGYTSKDVETLQWLKQQTDSGVPIGMAVMEWKSAQRNHPLASVLNAAKPMLALDSGARQQQPATEQAFMQEQVRQLLACFVELNQAGAQQLFEEMLAAYPLEPLLLELLQPTLIELGEMWARGEISEYQEHFGSHFIRDKMLALRGLFRPAADSPLLVTACGPGERHELGILMFGFFAQQAGFRVVYLGPSPSEKGIFDCLNDHAPAAFTFSFSLKAHLDAALPFLRKLDRKIMESGSDTRVFIGGRAIPSTKLLEGTERVQLFAGDGKKTLELIKAQLPGLS